MSALSNAVSVLRLFSGNRPELSVTEVARELGMAKSSASRLLKAMLREGLLANAGTTPRYRLGYVFFEISRLYGHDSTLMELADNALGAICRAARHGGYISILDGADVLVLRAYVGPEALRVVTPLGSRMPAFATATGRTLLARLTDQAVTQLHAEGLQPPCPNAPQSVDELLALLQTVRRTGWSAAIDEGVPGVGSVAVSIADPARAEAVALCLSFPAQLVCEVERRRIAATLTEAARHIAMQLDDRFWAKVKARKIAAA